MRTFGAMLLGAAMAFGVAAEAQPQRPPIVGVSHLAVYASDAAKAEHFYVHDLGAVRRPDPEHPRGVRYHFGPHQFVEVLPLPPGHASINRLDHAAFITTDAEALRLYLASKGVATPPRLQQGADGGLWFDVTDPEGVRIQFVQPPTGVAESAASQAISNRVMHVGFIVHDRARQDRFYREVLGFRPYWFGGMTDDKPTWISLQVPEGADWLEYMIVDEPAERGVPANMSQATLGVLNHFALGVDDVKDAYTHLWKGERLEGQKGLPQLGRDAKWQLNLIDPDGTRAELMEFAPVGEPCCSPFTAPHPHP